MAVTEVDKDIIEALTEFNMKMIEMADRMERVMLTNLKATIGLAKKVDDINTGKLPILNPSEFGKRLNGG